MADVPTPHPLGRAFNVKLNRLIDDTLAECERLDKEPHHPAQASVLGVLLSAGLEGAKRSGVPFDLVVQMVAHTYGADVLVRDDEGATS